LPFPYLSLSIAPDGTPFRDLNGNGVMEHDLEDVLFEHAGEETPC